MKVRFGLDAPVFEVLDKGGFFRALNSHFCDTPFDGVDLSCFVFADLACVGCADQWHKVEGVAVRPLFMIEGGATAAWVAVSDFQRRLVNTSRLFFDDAVERGFSFYPVNSAVPKTTGVVLSFSR